MEIIKDIIFDESSKQALDIYLPETIKTAPVLVWFHGGGMQINTKSIWEVTCFGESFPQQGFIVVAPDYRKVPDVKYPVYLEDAAAALAWVFKNIAEYGGDPDKIFVGGHSAGAYLAAMITMAPQFLATHEIDHLKIKGLIPISGQMDTHMRVREERNIDDDGILIDKAAPWYYITPKLCPMLIMAADNDMPNRAERNIKFVEELKKAGHFKSKYIEIPGR